MRPTSPKTYSFTKIPGYDRIRRTVHAGHKNMNTRLQLASQPTPVAAYISEEEIEAQIARGDDPYALSADLAPLSSNSEFTADAILAAFKLAKAFETATGRSNVSPAHEIIAIEVPTEEDAIVYGKACRAVFDVSEEFNASRTQTSGHEVWIDGEQGFGKISAHAALQRLNGILRNGSFVVIITDDLHRFSDDTKALVDLVLRPKAADKEMVLATLSLSHSETGQLATEELFDRLPSTALLARLSGLQMDRAFSGKTTLDVADALRAACAKLAKPKSPQLSDLFGQPQLKDVFNLAIDDLQAWQMGSINWTDVTPSFLLYGPPGTGKTMAAQAFANTIDLPCIVGSYAEWQSTGHQGQMLAAMQAAVNEAIAKAPSVFFLDEIDSFGARSQAGTNSQYMRGVVNGLLTALTRLNETPGVFVVAATNYPELVDPAILRAGRLDRHVYVRPLDREGIRQMLEHHCGTVMEQADHSGEIINSLIGMSGAEIARVVRQAKSRARAAGQDFNHEHIVQVLPENVTTTEKTFLWRVALHEAGHAVVSIHSGNGIPEKVCVSEKNGATFFPEKATLTETGLHAALTTLLAGRAAEREVLGTLSSGGGTGPESDLAIATKLATKAVLQFGFSEGAPIWEDLPSPFHLTSLTRKQIDEVSKLLQNADKSATTSVRRYHEEIKLLALALVEKRELGAKDLRCILDIKDQAVPQQQDW